MLEIIGAHHDAAANRGAALNDTANADDAPLDVRIRDNAPVGDDRLTQSRPVDFAAGQKPRMRVNRRLGVKKTVFRNKVGQIEVRLVKRADGTDIFPIALENECTHMSILDRSRNDMFAEILQFIVQALHEHLPVENVNSHRCLKQFFVFA